jgi:hypothetical protein
LKKGLSLVTQKNVALFTARAMEVISRAVRISRTNGPRAALDALILELPLMGATCSSAEAFVRICLMFMIVPAQLIFPSRIANLSGGVERRGRVSFERLDNSAAFS